MPHMDTFCGPGLQRLSARLFRRKVYYDPAPQGEPPTIVDLVVSGLVPSLTLALLVLSGLVVVNLAGPSAILSVLIAAVTSALSVLCFADLRFMLGRVRGDDYDFLYYTVGELPAVLVGWTFFLYHVTLGASFARATSQTIDCLTGNRILNLTSIHLGKIHGLNSYPDLLSISVVLLALLLFRWSPWSQRLVYYVISVVTGLVGLFILVVGVFHSRPSNWSSGKGFIPNGNNGIFVAAAVIYVVFDGLKRSTAKADTKSTKQEVVASWITIFFTLTFVTFGACAITSLLIHFDFLVTETPMEEAFSKVGMEWMNFVSALGAIPLLFMCCVMEIDKTFSSVNKLCSDGVFIIQGDESEMYARFKVAIAIFTLLLMSICSVFFRIVDLIMVCSLTSLLRGIIATLVSLLLRYRAPEVFARPPDQEVTQTSGVSSQESYGSMTGTSDGDTQLLNGAAENQTENSTSYKMLNGRDHTILNNKQLHDIEEQDSSDPDIDELVEEYKSKVRIRRWRMRRTAQGHYDPSSVTSLRATWALLGYTFSVTFLCILLNYASAGIKVGDVISIIFLCVFLTLVLLSLGFLLRQPIDNTGRDDVIIKTPIMPYTGLVTLTLQIFLAVKIWPWVWGSLILWMLPGVLVYCLYGIKHSELASMDDDYLPEENRGLLHASTSGP